MFSGNSLPKAAMVLGRFHFSIEVPIRDIVVETDALSAAVLGDNFHDIRLLLG